MPPCHFIATKNKPLRTRLPVFSSPPSKIAVRGRPSRDANHLASRLGTYHSSAITARSTRNSAMRCPEPDEHGSNLFVKWVYSPLLSCCERAPTTLTPTLEAQASVQSDTSISRLLVSLPSVATTALFTSTLLFVTTLESFLGGREDS
ncbi:hypothetical protein M0802_012017 [Mischocyttarus mexicanus]|nr:hypothetical protein M0802_012017 [Mischocyttarus mexicanus]